MARGPHPVAPGPGGYAIRRIIAAMFAAAVVLCGQLSTAARADNPMGYRLLSTQEAAALPQRHGALGLDVARARQISEDGMVFDIMRIQQVRPGSTGGQAGLRIGDEIIAVNGRVFPGIAAFAAYVGSMPPGSYATIDYIPAGGGPGQAERLGVTLGGAGWSGQPGATAGSGGLSSGAKLAIGAGAAALLCYRMGCLSHGNAAPPQPAFR